MLKKMKESTNQLPRSTNPADTTLQGRNTGKIIKKHIVNLLKKMYTCLLWILSILHYINIIYWLYRAIRSLWKPKPYRLRRYDYGATLVYRVSLIERCRLYFIGESGKRKRLLNWISTKLPTFCVDDFTVCWSNGITICALIDAVVPDTCPRYDLLNPEYTANNCRLGMRLVAKTLGIGEPMTPQQMSNPRAIPEELMVQYLQMIKYASKIPVKEPERVMLKFEETMQVNDKECTSTGSGLVVAIEGKRTKFNIHADAFIWKNIFVEITGPRGEYCKRKIDHAKAQKSSRKMSGEKDEPDKDNRLIYFDYDEIKEGEYQVIYIPCNVGKYLINITWGGEDIKNSPFSVQVKEPRSTTGTGTSKHETVTKRVSFNTDNPSQQKASQSQRSASVAKQGRRQSLFRQSKLESDLSSETSEMQPESNREHRNSVKLQSNRSGSIFGSSVKNQSGRRGKVIRKIIRCPSGDKEIRYASKSITTQKSVTSSITSGPKSTRNQVTNVEDMKYVKFADRLSKQLIGRVYYEITKQIIQVKSKKNHFVTDDEPHTDALNMRNLSKSGLEEVSNVKESRTDIDKSQDIHHSEVVESENKIRLRANIHSHNDPAVLTPTGENELAATDVQDPKPVDEEASQTNASTDESKRQPITVTSKPEENVSIEANEPRRSSIYDTSLDSSISIDDTTTTSHRFTNAYKPYRPTWQLPTIDRPSEDFDTEPSQPTITDSNETTQLHKNTLYEPNISGESLIKNGSQDVIQNQTNVTDSCLANTAEFGNITNKSDIPIDKDTPSIESQILMDQTSDGIPNRFYIPFDVNRNEPDTSAEKKISDVSKIENTTSAKGDTDQPVQNSPEQGIDVKEAQPQCKTDSTVSTNTRATQSNTRIIRRSSRNKPSHDKATQCTADSIRKATGWGQPRHRQLPVVIQDPELNSESNPKDSHEDKDVDAPVNSRRDPEVGIDKLKRPKRSRAGVRQATFDSGFSDEQALSGNSRSPESILREQPDVAATSSTQSNTNLQTFDNVNQTEEKSFSTPENKIDLSDDITRSLTVQSKPSDHSHLIDEAITPDDDVTSSGVMIENATPVATRGTTKDQSTEEEKLNEPIDQFGSIEVETMPTDCLSPTSACSPLAGSSNDADVSNLDESSIDASVFETSSQEIPHKVSSDRFFLPTYPFQEWIRSINYDVDHLDDVTNHLHIMQHDFESFCQHRPKYPMPRSNTSSTHDRYRPVYGSDTSCRSTSSFGNNLDHCPHVRRQSRRRCVCDESSSSFTSSDFSCPRRQCHGCKVFGVGLHDGYVNMKNNFQVETSEASGDGYLSVIIRGPNRHSVTEISVVFTGDDLYEVIYEVNMPGFYVISVKWSEQHVSNSPFIVAVKH